MARAVGDSTMRDAIYLTISKIEDDEVAGTIYIKGPAHYHNRDLAFTGRLRGTTLAGSYATVRGDPPVSYEWEIGPDGKSMTGWGQATVRASNVVYEW
jgi:hypothetical protein